MNLQDKINKQEDYDRKITSEMFSRLLDRRFNIINIQEMPTKCPVDMIFEVSDT